MAPTFLQSFSQIVFKENSQSCLKVFGDFPALQKRTSRGAAVTIYCWFN